MTESSLSKIWRLTGVRPAASVRRGGPSGKPPRPAPATEQAAGGHLQLNSSYRAAWGNVSVGDVVEFADELWKVIPASNYPNHKHPGTVKMPSPKPPQDDNDSGGSGTGGATGSGSSSPTPTHTLYLQDVKHPSSYDELTLPASFVVHIVPVAPA